jgi:hypothetical protein
MVSTRVYSALFRGKAGYTGVAVLPGKEADSGDILPEIWRWLSRYKWAEVNCRTEGCAVVVASDSDNVAGEPLPPPGAGGLGITYAASTGCRLFRTSNSSF